MLSTAIGEGGLRAHLQNGEVEVRGRDGRPYHLRSIRPSDAASLMRGYDAMSKEAKWFRMLYTVPHLTPEMAQRYCSPDPARDYCVVVEGRDALDGEILGGARIGGAGDGHAAEFSVSLRPEAQGKGLAEAALSTVLDIAREMKFTTIWGVIAANNAPMIGLARKLGFQLVPNPDDLSEVVGEISLGVHSSSEFHKSRLS